MTEPALTDPVDVHLSQAEYVIDNKALANQDGTYAVAHALIALTHVLKRLVDEDLGATASLSNTIAGMAPPRPR